MCVRYTAFYVNNSVTSSVLWSCNLVKKCILQCDYTSSESVKLFQLGDAAILCERNCLKFLKRFLSSFPFQFFRCPFFAHKPVNYSAVLLVQPIAPNLFPKLALDLIQKHFQTCNFSKKKLLVKAILFVINF